MTNIWVASLTFTLEEAVVLDLSSDANLSHLSKSKTMTLPEGTRTGRNSYVVWVMTRSWHLYVEEILKWVLWARRRMIVESSVKVLESYEELTFASLIVFRNVKSYRGIVSAHGVAQIVDVLRSFMFSSRERVRFLFMIIFLGSSLFCVSFVVEDSVYVRRWSATIIRSQFIVYRAISLHPDTYYCLQISQIKYVDVRFWRIHILSRISMSPRWVAYWISVSNASLSQSDSRLESVSNLSPRQK